MMKRKFLMAAILFVSLAGCSSVKDSAEYKKLKSEWNNNEEKIGELSSELSQLKDEISSIDGDLESLSAERRDLREKIGLALSNPAIRARVIDSHVDEVCSNRAEAYFALSGQANDNDPDYWEKFEETSSFLGLKDTDLPSSVDDDETNLSLAANTGFKVFESESKARCDSAFDKRFWEVMNEACKGFTPLVLKKDPELHKGKCWVGSVEVVQFDSNTGKCAFHGWIDGDYDVRASFGVSLDPNSHSTQTECSWTSDIVEGMRIKFWGWGLGTYSYETTSGGTMTIPSFRLMGWQGQ